MIYFPILPTKLSGTIKVTVTGETAISKSTATKSIKISVSTWETPPVLGQ